MNPLSNPRILLIGGSSHAGKSTLAQALATRLRWKLVSTDKLARHPGRPWKPAPQVVPEHVANHYLSHEIDELVADVTRHYCLNVWPFIHGIVSAPAEGGVVIEGSAVMPELIRSLHRPEIVALWLTARPAVFERRIHDSSGYGTKSEAERTLIDKFVGRTLSFDALLRAAVPRLGFPLIDSEQIPGDDALLQHCLIELHLEQRPSIPAFSR